MTSYPMQVITGNYTSPSGAVFPIGPGTRYLETLKRNADNQPAPYKPGLGTWRVGIQTWDDQRKHPSWVYIAPSGIEYPTFFYLARYPEPPPLPQPVSARRACSCGSAHVCSECGQPYFIEIHGVADGYCTYCYHSG
jgi:hypothetical protein